MAEIAFQAIGTQWHIQFSESGARLTVAQVSALVREKIEEFDAVYSRFRADSLVSAIAQSAGAYTLPGNAAPLLALYAQLYDVSGGVFTPLVGNTLRSLGYDADYSLTPAAEIERAPAWEATIHYTPPTLTARQPVLLDFGAAGKGYLVDLVAELLLAQGITTFTVDASGDVCHRDPADAPVRIGLEHPEDTTQAIGVVTLANRSVCGSAGNRRTWGTYHHIVNPAELASPKSILATWVVADTTLLADALATCLFLVPVEKLVEKFTFEYAILRDTYTIEQSPAFPAEFFT